MQPSEPWKALAADQPMAEDAGDLGDPYRQQLLVRNGDENCQRRPRGRFLKLQRPGGPKQKKPERIRSNPVTVGRVGLFLEWRQGVDHWLFSQCPGYLGR